MILSAHQPAYLPWLGYFDKIKRSDVFVYMDTVQFEKNSFINRNQIKTSQGAMWLTVAVKHKGHTTASMQNLEIDPHCQWQKKHLRAIAMNYAKAKNFARLYPQLEQLYQPSYDLLVELCWHHLQFWLYYLNINTKIVRLSDFSIEGKKSDLVLNMCQYFKADHYISGALGKDYLIESDFEQQGIRIEYQKFIPPSYPQLYDEFLPHLSVLDYCMNCDEGLI